jgi:hypothetical protein
MRVVLTLALAAGFAMGCGGGGTTTAGPASQVQGKVTVQSLDGPALGGVDVRCLNDGGVVVTRPDGSFVLTVPSGETLRLRVSDPDANGVVDLPECDEEGDESGDKGDFEGDVVEIEALEDGEVCEIEITLADGRVIEAEFGFGEDGFHAEGRLLPAEPGGDDAPVGEIEITLEGACGVLELEAEHLTPGTGLEILLVNPELVTETLARAEVTAEGYVHLRLERCEGDTLPFGAATLADLAGYGVVVQDLEGNVLLVGVVPFGLGEHPDGFPDFEEGEEHELPPLPEFDLEDLERLLDELEGLLGDGNPLLGLLPR